MELNISFMELNSEIVKKTNLRIIYGKIVQKTHRD